MALSHPVEPALRAARGEHATCLPGGWGTH
jgi:hypothetical protein